MHNVTTITRSELYDLVWSKPMIQLSKDFNLSDNGLRKICKKHNIPTPQMGYWQKVEFKKKVKVIPLPKGENTIIEFSEIEHPSKGKVNIKDNSYIELLKKNHSLILKVADRLINPHKITILTQKAIDNRLKDEWVRRSKTVSTHEDVPRVSVSKTLVPRTLRILDALLKNFDAVGYKVSVESEGLFIYSEDEKMEVYIKERETATTTVDARGWSNRTLSPSGKLTVKIRYHWRIFEFVDDKNRLIEDKILDILTRIESEFVKEKEQLRIWKIERDRLEALRKIEEGKQKRKDDELQKFVTYYNDAHRWKKYMVLKEYYDYLKSNNLKSEEELSWIRTKLDWYNPSLNATDELLGEVDKEKLTMKKY